MGRSSQRSSEAASATATSGAPQTRCSQRSAARWTAQPRLGRVGRGVHEQEVDALGQVHQRQVAVVEHRQGRDPARQRQALAQRRRAAARRRRRPPARPPRAGGLDRGLQRLAAPGDVRDDGHHAAVGAGERGDRAESAVPSPLRSRTPSGAAAAGGVAAAGGSGSARPVPAGPALGAAAVVGLDASAHGRAAVARRHGVERLQGHARADDALPALDVELDDGVVALVHVDAGGALAHAEADRAGVDAAGAEAHLEVLAVAAPAPATRGRRRAPPGAPAGCPRPKGASALERLGGGEGQVAAADDRVDRPHPRAVDRRADALRRGDQLVAEARDRGGGQLQPDRAGVTAPARQGPGGRATRGRGGRRPATLRPDPLAVSPMARDARSAGRSKRSARREATMPTTPSCQPSPEATTTPARPDLRPARPRPGRSPLHDRALDLAPLGVERPQLGADRVGRLAVGGQQQLERAVRVRSCARRR